VLSPDDPTARLWLGVVAIIFVLVLLYNTLQTGSRPYKRFVKFTSSWKRRNLMRKWLNQSFMFFGGLSLIALVLSWQFVVPLLDEFSALRESPLTAWGITALIAVVLVIAPLLVVGKTRIPRAVELAALLPRNRQELRLSAALSLNAALVEEALFRLALPALLFGATGNALVAVGVSVLLFGVLNAYRGVLGALSMTIVGALLMATYLLTGIIVVPMVIHALIDLRTLVFVPVVFGRVHRTKARW
jgi:membrane protease YdiL (CAAX protease family)